MAPIVTMIGVRSLVAQKLLLPGMRTGPHPERVTSVVATLKRAIK